MSRIGRQPIKIPSGVKVQLGEASLQVQGPKGTVSCLIPPGIAFDMKGQILTAKPKDEAVPLSAMHGLARSLAAGAVKGVVDGYKKDLEIYGVGFKAQKKGNAVVFNLGYSHPIEFPIPEGITVTVDEKSTKLSVAGADKQLVGQIAANMRRLRSPDPYKNKGVRYAGEVLKKKAGKTGAK